MLAHLLRRTHAPCVIWHNLGCMSRIVENTNLSRINQAVKRFAKIQDALWKGAVQSQPNIVFARISGHRQRQREGISPNAAKTTVTLSTLQVNNDAHQSEPFLCVGTAVLSAVYMRIARGDSAMSFHTSRYSRFFSSGERFSTASALRLIHGRRSAALPTATTKGFKRLLRPEKSLPSEIAPLARFEKGNCTGASAA